MLIFSSMLSVILAAGLMLGGLQLEERGIITGAVIAPQAEVSQPVQVILLPPRYLDLWNSEDQKQLDRYWQQHQPTFRNRKELFSEFSKQAHRDATDYVVTRMRRDRAKNVSEYLTETAPDGKFEFKNLPFGEYKV